MSGSDTTPTEIEQDFQKNVDPEVQLVAVGRAQYQVVTPFHFNDGDHLVIVLKEENGYWLLSDEGHTYMHLADELDDRNLDQGRLQSIISDALGAFSVEDVDGELRRHIADSDYGAALRDFVQTLTRISEAAGNDAIQS